MAGAFALLVVVVTGLGGAVAYLLLKKRGNR